MNGIRVFARASAGVFATCWQQIFRTGTVMVIAAAWAFFLKYSRTATMGGMNQHQPATFSTTVATTISSLLSVEMP